MVEKHVKRYTLSQQVADQLEKMIQDGVYTIGEKIPTEPELTEMFGVSRNTLREAVQSLTSSGILLVKQGDGTYVQSDNRFHANMAMKYQQVSMGDILEARNALEITIAYLASLRRTGEDLQKIKQALDCRQMTEKHENTRADLLFHMAIADACHNSILTDLYNSIASYMEAHIAEQEENTTLSSAEIDRLHEKLYLSILSQDSDGSRICAQKILDI